MCILAWATWCEVFVFLQAKWYKCWKSAWAHRYFNIAFVCGSEGSWWNRDLLMGHKAFYSLVFSYLPLIGKYKLLDSLGEQSLGSAQVHVDHWFSK